MKRFVFLLTLFAVSAGLLSAQEASIIPEDVFYLMPSFGNGSVVYRGQPPIRGSFNICAVDNTVRFKDADGQELAAEDTDLVQVSIDNVTFVKDGDHFLRLYPVSEDVSIAVHRNVLVFTDSKTGAYGGQSQTTAVTEYSGFTSEGQLFRLDDVRELPYRVSETASLCRDQSVIALNKRNLQRCFPQSKDAIDEYFRSHKSLPANDIPAILELCKLWAQ